jgi:hypothetical protein
MLAFPVQLRGGSAGLRMLIPGGEGIDTPTPRGSTVFTVMAALAQTELEIKGERIADLVATGRVAGKDLGGRRPTLIARPDPPCGAAHRGGGVGHPGGTGPRDVESHPLPADAGSSAANELRSG